MERKQKVLIVDDDVGIRESLSRLLEEAGFECAGAEDGQEGWDRLLRGNFDVALIDLRMPKMDGIQLLDEVRNSKCPTVLVVLSGHGETNSVVEAMKRGAFDFLEKPVDDKVLQAAVDRAATHAYISRHAENMARLAEIWETVFDASPEMIVVLDNDMRILRCNRATTERFQTENEALIGRFCPRVFDGLDGLQETSLFAEDPDRATNQTSNHFEFHHPDWNTDFSVTQVPLTNGSEGVWGTVCTLHDITDPKRAEEELRAAHAEMKLVLRSISSILIGVGPDGSVMQWNAAAEEAFGVGAEEVIGRSFPDCEIPWDWEILLPPIQDSLTQDESKRLNDVHFTRPDGKEGLLEITISPFVRDSEDPPGFLLLASDITEQRILTAQLSQAQKLESIGQLAAGIAHEINTPTQYVGDNTRFLKDSFDDLMGLYEKYAAMLASAKEDAITPDLIAEIESAMEEADIEYMIEEIPRALRQSIEGLGQVAKIVGAMKEFSHPGTAEKTAVDINKLLESTITISRNEWKYCAEMVTDFDASLPLVPCLPGEFNQVVLNLIVNASHAIVKVVGENAEEKGKITVCTRRNEDRAEIRISDTGSGIPEAIRTRVFDPFFTTKEVGKGTGQGLAISRSVVVEKHGGTITLESEEGKGTVFTIRLPLNGDTV